LCFLPRTDISEQHALKILVDSEIKNRLSCKDDTTICIPSVKREGRSKPNLLLEEKSRVVLVFVEHHESKYYQDQINGIENHFLVVLPEKWVRYGCRVVRQVIKSVVETLHPGLYCQMDDDCIGVYRVDDQGERKKHLTVIEMINFLESNMKSDPTAILCCQPARNSQRSKSHWKYYKHEKANTNRAEKLVLFNPNFTRKVHYAPPVVFDLVGELDNLGVHSKLKAAMRQGEDFGLCYQLGNTRCTMFRRYYLSEQNTPSRNKTKKQQESKGQHNLLVDLDEDAVSQA